MKEISIKSYAKINLSLDVLGLLPNGYHQVEMIMQQLELHDLLTVKWIECEHQVESKIVLTTNNLELPLDNQNIAYKAAQIMMQNLHKVGRVEIHIEKNIPVSAGLAGGSGNGAAVLHALNFLWKAELSVKELSSIGVELGADVPFCVMGQAKGNRQLGEYINNDALACTCALAEGIGEKLKPVMALDCEVLLSKPAIGISTKEVYEGIDTELGFTKSQNQGETIITEHHIDTQELIMGLNTKNQHKIVKNISNILELFSTKRYPIIVYTKDKIKQQGNCSKVLMSGSGPTVFGIYFEKEKILEDYRVLCEINKETYMTKTLV